MKNSLTFIIGLALTLGLYFSLNNNAMSDEQKKPAPQPKVAEGHEQITLGAGCFWCIEAIYDRLDGVISSTSGYMGGTRENPTYEDVIRRNTGEVEVLKVVFDPKKISREQILKFFWELHDPTQADGQGGDIGPQYLSTIFYHSEEQKASAEKSKTAAQAKYKKPIATQIKKAGTFYPAENYHQDYYRLNKDKNPYCRAVITPKIEKLKLQDKPAVKK